MSTVRLACAGLLAVAVLLAGCNLPATGSAPAVTPSPEPTATSSPTPTSAPTRARPADIGVGPDGVEDPFQLAQVHGVWLAGQSFTVTDATTVRDANGTVLYERTVRARVGPNHLAYTAVTTREAAAGAPAWVLEPYPEEPPRTAVYSNATMAVERSSGDGEPVIRVRRGPGLASPRLSPDRYVGRSTVALLFREVEAPVTGVHRENGTTVYVLTAEGGQYAHGTTFPYVRDVTGTVRSFRAVVTAYGLVRDARLEYAVSRNGTTFVVTRRLSFAAVGATTVDRPAWVAGALADPDEVLPNETAATVREPPAEP